MKVMQRTQACAVDSKLCLIYKLLNKIMFENINLVGRVVFGLYFAYSGLMHFVNSKGMVEFASYKKIPLPTLAVYGSGLIVLLGGLGVTFDFYKTASLALIVLFLVPTSVFMHDFWNDTDANTKMNNRIGFLKNVALIGAALAMF